MFLHLLLESEMDLTCNCKIPLALKKFYRCKDPSHAHDVCIRYKGKENKRDLIFEAILYPSSSHIVMDIKCPQNTLGTFMEYIVLWQIVFGTSKAKCLFCHHPQDQKTKFVHHGQKNVRMGVNRSSSSVHAIWTHFTSCERKIIKRAQNK